MSTAFTLRPTTPSDIPALHALMRDFAAYEKLEHRFKITQSRLHEALFTPNPPLHSIMAEADGAPIGFAIWFFLFGTFSGERGLFVEDVYVQQTHRGQGIGLALFRHMARVAQEHGCTGMDWSVLDWNTPAIEFYRRIGAKPIEGWIPQSLNGDAFIALANGANNA